METARSHKELMLSGEYYDSWDKELVRMREHALRLTTELNATHTSETDKRDDLIGRLFGSVGPRCYVTPPFNCDYGCFTSLGENVYMNFGCVILDCARVTIGDNVLFGPNVQLYAATHPTNPEDRLAGKEMARPISIGHNVWLGGSVVVCPGVTIGEDTTIGAGSVVTKDIPARCVAAGNPCRVIRRLEPRSTAGTTAKSLPLQE